MANINKIRLSGTTYNIEDENAAKSVTLTQAEYDALVSGGTVDPNTFYIISDSSISYMTSADTESAITQAVSGKQDTLVSGTNIKTINNQSILGSGDITIQGGGISSGEVQTMIDNSISGKTNQSDFSAHTANTTVHVTAQDKTNWNAKSDFSGSYNDLTNKLSAGTNITIVDNVISAEGGSDINVVQTTGTSTADVMSQDAVTTQLNNKANKTAAVGGYKFGTYNDVDYLQYTNVNKSNIGNEIYYPRINGKGIFTNNSIYAQNNYDFQLVEASAITTSVTSSSTDAQVPSAKAVYDALGSSGGNSVVELTQAEYDALTTVDPDTFYVITDAQEIDTDNYYTTEQTQSAITQAVSGKADTSAVTTVNNALTAHTADTTIHVTTAQTAAWDAKQNALTIDSTVTSGSTNPVSGGAVYTQFGGLKLVKLTQTQYNALSTKDSNTLYVIVN